MSLIEGRWAPALRRLYTGLALMTCAVMLLIALDGPIVIAPISDQTVKFFMVLIVVFTLIDLGVKWLRRVNPAPHSRTHAIE